MSQILNYVKMKASKNDSYICVLLFCDRDRILCNTVKRMKTDILFHVSYNFVMPGDEMNLRNKNKTVSHFWIWILNHLPWNSEGSGSDTSFASAARRAVPRFFNSKSKMGISFNSNSDGNFVGRFCGCLASGCSNPKHRFDQATIFRLELDTTTRAATMTGVLPCVLGIRMLSLHFENKNSNKDWTFVEPKLNVYNMDQNKKNAAKLHYANKNQNNHYTHYLSIYHIL